MQHDAACRGLYTEYKLICLLKVSTIGMIEFVWEKACACGMHAGLSRASIYRLSMLPECMYVYMCVCMYVRMYGLCTESGHGEHIGLFVSRLRHGYLHAARQTKVPHPSMLYSMQTHAHTHILQCYCCTHTCRHIHAHILQSVCTHTHIFTFAWIHAYRSVARKRRRRRKWSWI